MDLKNQTQKRIIKFRGQNISGHWNYGLLCNDKDKDSDYEWFISNSAGKPYAFGCIEKTIGQFTGFYDKNKKEIYEGDIIKGLCRNWVVFFQEGLFKTKVGQYLLEGEFEIIGNIHENPELLNP